MPENSTHPVKKSQYSYFFRSHPEIEAELKKLNIRLIDLGVGEGETWPALMLPSGAVMAIARDDEGNGPGAIHCFRKSELQ